MTQRPQPRRGLGRGLGSLIPTAPRPEPAQAPDSDVEHSAADGRAPEMRTGHGDGLERAGAGSGVLAPDRSAEGGEGVGFEPRHALQGGERPVEDERLGAVSDLDGVGQPHGHEHSHGPEESYEPHGQDLRHAAPHGHDEQHDERQDESHGQDEPHDESHGHGEGRDESHGHDDSDGRDASDGQHERARQDERQDGSRGHEEPQGHREPRNPEELAPVAGAYFAELPLEVISPNPRQPRQVFDEDALAELVQSIREVGLLQPVVVRPSVDGTYELIMGERRWRATQQAGLDTIPAIVRETGDDDLLRDALLENLHRADLNPLEEAAAYQQLLDDFGCTHEELASRIGRSRPQISNTLRLLKLTPAVQRRVAAGVLSAGHARALLAVEETDAQDRLAGRVVAEGISVRGLEEIVAVGNLGVGQPARRSKPTAPGLEDLAARLSDRLETRVKVDLGKRKGRITVEFASLPDLERIIGVIDPGHPTRTHQESPSL